MEMDSQRLTPKFFNTPEEQVSEVHVVFVLCSMVGIGEFSWTDI